MSLTSIPVIANDKNKPECIFPLLKCYFFYLENCSIQHRYTQGQTLTFV